MGFFRVLLSGAITLLIWCPVARGTTCLGGVSVWPPSNTTIPRNAQIVMESNGNFGGWISISSQELLTSVSSGESRPYLWGPRGKIPLRIAESYFAPGWKPGTDILQVVLEPTRRLEPNARYDLRLAAREGPSPALTWATWRTSSKEDRRGPRWAAAAAVRESRYYEDDGPGASFVVEVPATDDVGPVQVLVELQSRVGLELQTVRWRVPFDSFQKINLWSGICGGIIEPKVWRSYRASLTAVDAAGNKAVWCSGAMRRGVLALTVPTPPPTITVSLPEHCPRVLKRVEPTYPHIARKAGVSGNVEVGLTIGPDGRVAQVTARGAPLLLDETKEAMQQWVFEPGFERQIQVTVTYSLYTP